MKPTCKLRRIGAISMPTILPCMPMQSFFGPRLRFLNTLLLFSGSEEVHWRLNSTGQFPFVWLPLPSWQMDSVPFLANSVQHSTIMVYLPAVRSLHIDQGFPDPLVDCLCLQRVLPSIKQSQGATVCLPTTDISLTIFLDFDLSCFNHCMFWAACSLANFGLLRLVEFSCQSRKFCAWSAFGCFGHGHWLSNGSFLLAPSYKSFQDCSFSQRLLHSYQQRGLPSLRHSCFDGLSVN